MRSLRDFGPIPEVWPPRGPQLELNTLVVPEHKHRSSDKVTQFTFNKQTKHPSAFGSVL